MGIDADDTLWPTTHLYEEAVAEFAEALAPWSPGISPAQIEGGQFQAAPRYGWGALALLRTMVDAAVRCGPEAASEACEKALKLIEMIHEDGAHPFTGAFRALSRLRAKGLRLALITQGSVAEQTAKLERSGLAERFDTVAVLAHKDADTYRRLLKDLGEAPEHFVMFGNSVTDDIEPVLEIGGRAILCGAADDPRPRGVPAVPYLRDLPNLFDGRSTFDAPGSPSGRGSEADR